MNERPYEAESTTIDTLVSENLAEFQRFSSSVSTAGVVLPSGDFVSVDGFFLSHWLPDEAGHCFFDHRTGMLVDRLREFHVQALWSGEPKGPAAKFVSRLSPRQKRRVIISLGFVGGFFTSIFVGILSSESGHPLLPQDANVPVAVVSLLVVMSLLLMGFVYAVNMAEKYALVQNVERQPGHLGGFEGGSLVFRETDLIDFLSNNDESQIKGATVANVTREIVKECRRSVPPTKKVARARFGGGLSNRAFDRAWRSAAEQYPELSKPGRRRLD